MRRVAASAPGCEQARALAHGRQDPDWGAPLHCAAAVQTLRLGFLALAPAPSRVHRTPTGALLGTGQKQLAGPGCAPPAAAGRAPW